VKSAPASMLAVAGVTPIHVVAQRDAVPVHRGGVIQAVGDVTASSSPTLALISGPGMSVP